ncbi:MAG: hypothetical protein BGO78_08095 [Chloroflexi bacterium 44-23]|nr:MAG: hypothetical protein BGO78_08095 [Chloroflexi bacterium 44-23]
MDSDQNNDMTVPSPNEPPKPEPSVPQPERLVEVPSYSSQPLQGEPVVGHEVPDYGTGGVVPPPVKKDNKKVWIIVAIVIVLLCCCCLIVAFVVTKNTFGSFNFQEWQNLLDDYSQIIHLMPAFI